MQNHNYNTGTPNQLQTSKIKRQFYRTFRFILLLSAFFVFTGHEKTNPKIDQTDIDFYLNDCSRLLKLQTNTLLFDSLNSDSLRIEYLVNRLVKEFYDIRIYNPAWTINFNTNKNYLLLKNLLDSTVYFGLPTYYINVNQLVNLEIDFYKSIKTNDINNRVELEIQSSKEFFRFLIALNKGIVNSDTSIEFINFTHHLPVIVNNAINNNKIEDLVNYIQPDFVPYKLLVGSISKFVSVQKTFDTLELKNKNIPDDVLAYALFYAGILEQPKFDSLNGRESALIEFQEENNLPAKGKINPITLLEIRELLDLRYYQICLNLDRMRKMHNSEDNYIFVNIPEYKLYLIENDKKSEVFNVIVGNEKTPTPLLSSRIESFVINPHWTVPRSISDKEMLERIRKDSTFLQRNGFTIVDNRENPIETTTIDWTSKNPLGGDYWIRQKNSKNNALGSVKFLFPNKYRVYLHDTPGKHLFKKENRTFSHGCIRVQDPHKLAEILSERYCTNNGQTDINTLLKKKESRVISLSKPIAIQLGYFTCKSDENGNIVFLKDIYKRDKKELNALFPNLASI